MASIKSKRARRARSRHAVHEKVVEDRPTLELMTLPAEIRAMIYRGTLPSEYRLAFDRTEPSFLVNMPKYIAWLRVWFPQMLVEIPLLLVSKEVSIEVFSIFVQMVSILKHCSCSVFAYPIATQKLTVSARQTRFIVEDNVTFTDLKYLIVFYDMDMVHGCSKVTPLRVCYLDFDYHQDVDEALLQGLDRFSKLKVLKLWRVEPNFYKSPCTFDHDTDQNLIIRPERQEIMRKLFSKCPQVTVYVRQETTSDGNTKGHWRLSAADMARVRVWRVVRNCDIFSLELYEKAPFEVAAEAAKRAIADSQRLDPQNLA